MRNIAHVKFCELMLKRCGRNTANDEGHWIIMNNIVLVKECRDYSARKYDGD